MTTPATDRLPNPHHAQSPEEYRAMSQRFLRHAEREIETKRRLQASEKIWGCISHQLAAIAEQRGWVHVHHDQFKDMCRYLDKEQGRRDLLQRLRGFEGFHRNFYRNDTPSGDIRQGIALAREYVTELEAIRQAGPRPYTVDNEHDQATVKSLTGWAPPLQTRRERGFSNRRLLKRRRAMWGKGRPDTDVPPTGGAPSRRNPPPRGGSSPAVRPVPPPQPVQVAVSGPTRNRPANLLNVNVGATMVEAPKFDGIVDIRGIKLDHPKPYKRPHRKARRGHSNPRMPSGRIGRR